MSLTPGQNILPGGVGKTGNLMTRESEDMHESVHRRAQIPGHWYTVCFCIKKNSEYGLQFMENHDCSLFH